MKIRGELPKNIRQIGEIPQDKRIYLEDYVVTYIRKKEKKQEKCVGVLFGSREENGEELRVFITGAAVLDEDLEKHHQFYFPDLVLVGYFVLGEMREDLLQGIEVGNMEKPFAIFHFQEDEEKIYWAEETNFSRLKGYFIFYERNPQMQKYIAEQCQPQKNEEEGAEKDKAIIHFREKVKEKNRLRSIGGMRYLAGSFLTLIILFLGVTIIQSYDRMRNMEEVISQISMEQERERLQLAGDYAAAEASSAQAAWEVQGGASLSDNFLSDSMDTMQLTDTESVSAASNAMPEDRYDALPDMETSQPVHTNDEPVNAEMTQSVSTDQAIADIEAMQSISTDQAIADIEATQSISTDQVMSDAEAAQAVGTDQALADMGISRAAQALSERNYSAEEAPLTEETAEVLSQRQTIAAYTVKYGDTLAGISQLYYGTLDRVEDICELNGIDDANMIVPGQKIVLP